MTFYKFAITSLFLAACSFQPVEQQGKLPPASAPAQTALMAVRSPAVGTGARFYTDGSSGEWLEDAGADAQGLRTSRFTATVRVLDTATRARIPSHEFETLVHTSPVWPSGTSGQRHLSSSDGEVVTTSQVRYHPLSSDSFKLYVLIRSHREPYEGATWAVPIEITPWLRGPGYYHDPLRQGGRAPASTQSKLVLRDYTAVFKGRGFELSDLLELTTLRTYTLTLRPEILRVGPLADARPAVLYPGTRLQVKVLLLDPESSDQNTRVLAAFEGPAEVQDNNEVRSNIVFAVPFVDQQRLDSRTRVHIELRSDETAVQPARLVASFVANPNGNDTTSGSSIAAAEAQDFEIPASYRKIAVGRGTALSPALLQGSAQKMYELLLARHSAGGPAQALKQPLTEKMAAADVAPYCDALTLTARQQACRQAPLDYFAVTQFEIVDQVLGPPSIAEVQNPFIDLAATFIHERQIASRNIEATKTADHWIGGATAKFGYEMLGSGATVQTAFNREQEWYDVTEIADGDSIRSRFSEQERIMLSQEEIVLRFPARVRSCALVRPLPFSAGKSQTTPLPLAFGCAAQARNKDVLESWYSVRERWNAVHSAHSDPKSALERGWSKLMRGKQLNRAFRKMTGDANKNFIFQRVDTDFAPATELGKQAFNTATPARRDGGIFPGILTLDETSALQWTENQIRGLATECVARVPENDPWRAKVAGFCRCYYDAAARRTTYEEFLKERTKWDTELRQTAKERCLDFGEGVNP